MPFLNKLRRSSTAADRYANQTAPYAASNIAKRRGSHYKQEQDSGDQIPQVLFEKDLYVPSDTGLRASASEISLRSEYTHLDNDTNRYPKLTRSLSGSSNTTQSRQSEDQPKGQEKVVRAVKAVTETQISPMLAVTSLPIKWDVRDSPAHIRQYRPNSQQNISLLTPAFPTKNKNLCLISHDFPWTLAISTQDGRPLTVMDVLEALYQSLQKGVRRSEWALAPDVRRYVMLEANRNRRNSVVPMGLRRVDWLGTRFMFKGLEKDEELGMRRLMPGDQPSEVWVARFGAMR